VERKVEGSIANKRMVAKKCEGGAVGGKKHMTEGQQDMRGLGISSGL
jgi:hypothetical protein